jgi:hypothetical protein
METEFFKNYFLRDMKKRGWHYIQKVVWDIKDWVNNTGNVKFTLEQAMNVQRGRRVIALLLL